MPAIGAIGTEIQATFSLELAEMENVRSMGAIERYVRAACAPCITNEPESTDRQVRRNQLVARTAW